MATNRVIIVPLGTRSPEGDPPEPPVPEPSLRNIRFENNYEADFLQPNPISQDPDGIYRNAVTYLYGWGEWGEPITITDIENTNPAIAHYTGTIVRNDDTFPPGYTLGTILSGMTEMSGRMFRPKNINTSNRTFQMWQDGDDEGITGNVEPNGQNPIDATGYGNFAGSVQAQAYKQVRTPDVSAAGFCPYDRTIQGYPYYPYLGIVDGGYVPPTNSLGPANPVPAQTGTRFLSTATNYWIDHSRNIDGDGWSNNNRNKPRWQLMAGTNELKLFADHTIWVGVALFLPSNFDNQSITRAADQSETQLVELQDDASSSSNNQWLLSIIRNSNDPAGYMSWAFSAYLDGNDPQSGFSEYIHQSPVVNDIGLWTTFVFKFKRDNGGPNGEIKVWKSTGPYLNANLQRKMELWYEVTGDVGGPLVTNPLGFDTNLKAYKYSWHHVTGAGDETVQWIGYDNFRFGTTEDDGTQYRDVHPFYEEEPVEAPVGADHIIPLNDASWSGTVFNVQPGDVIEIEGGQRDTLIIRNVQGTPELPVIIRSGSSQQSVIGRSTAGGDGFIFRFTNCKHFILDGTNTPGETYGIKVCSLVANDFPTSYLTFRDQCSDYEVKNIHVDGLDAGKTSNSPIGVFHNHFETIADPSNPSEWRENIRIHDCLIENVPGEGFYMGSNDVNEIPFRTTEIDHNIVRNCGRDGINLKSCWDGTCKIHHNDVSFCGLWIVEYTGGQDGIAIFEGVCNVYANVIHDIAENGIKQQTFNRTVPATMPVTDIYNNVIYRVGIGTDPILQDGIGIRLGAGGAAHSANVFNNTIIAPEDDGVQYAGAQIRTASCYNNIICSPGNQSVDAPAQITASNNMVGSLKALRFTDPDNDDYSLLEASPAINAAIGSPPLVDIAGNARPDGPASDVGAYEFNLGITGAIHIIEPSMSLATFANQNYSPGDGVFFRAGGTWTLTDQNDRIQCQNGVYYGRVGPGDNPIIDGNQSVVTFSQNFRSTVHIGDFGNEGINNVTWNGIDVYDSDSFGIFVRTADNPRIMNCRVTDCSGCGIGLIPGTTNAYVGYVEITGITDHPHEAISTSGADGFVIEYLFSHDNKFACIDVKDNSRNGVIRYSRFHNTDNDPMTYSERCENIEWHHNYVYDNTAGNNNKPPFSINLEGLGGQDTRYARNVEYHHNVIVTSHTYGIKLGIKFDTFAEVGVDDPNGFGNDFGVAEQLMSNLHIHHNTIYRMNILNEGWVPALWMDDGRGDLPQSTLNLGFSGKDPADWDNIVFEDNIFWDIGNTQKDMRDDGLPYTLRYNLFPTGAITEQYGTNMIETNNVNFVNAAAGDFRTLSGAAVGTGHDGSTVGANFDISITGVEWL